MPATITVPPFNSWLCETLLGDFQGDRTQTMWDGYLHYRICQHVLDRGFSLDFGVTGGDGTNGCRVRRARSGSLETTISEISGVEKDSVNLVVRSPSAGAPTLRLQAASYSQTGRKAGRATFGTFREGLDYLTERSPRSAAFVFVADLESYQSLRGIRRGDRGPEIKANVFPLPRPDVLSSTSAHSANVEDCQGIFYRIPTADEIERVLGVLWQPGQPV